MLISFSAMKFITFFTSLFSAFRSDGTAMSIKRYKMFINCSSLVKVIWLPFSISISIWFKLSSLKFYSFSFSSSSFLSFSIFSLLYLSASLFYFCSYCFSPLGPFSWWSWFLLIPFAYGIILLNSSRSWRSFSWAASSLFWSYSNSYSFFLYSKSKSCLSSSSFLLSNPIIVDVDV